MPSESNEFKARFSAHIRHICLHKVNDAAQHTVWTSPFQEQTVYHVLNCQVSKHVELLTNSLESFVG